MSVAVEQVGEGDEALQDLYVAFYLPPNAQGVLPPEWQAVALAGFFPDADLASLTYGPPFPAALQESEGWVVIVRWEH